MFFKNFSWGFIFILSWVIIGVASFLLYRLTAPEYPFYFEYHMISQNEVTLTPVKILEWGYEEGASDVFGLRSLGTNLGCSSFNNAQLPLGTSGCIIIPRNGDCIIDPGVTCWDSKYTEATE